MRLCADEHENVHFHGYTDLVIWREKVNGSRVCAVMVKWGKPRLGFAVAHKSLLILCHYQTLINLAVNPSVRRSIQPRGGGGGGKKRKREMRECHLFIIRKMREKRDLMRWRMENRSDWMHKAIWTEPAAL